MKTQTLTKGHLMDTFPVWAQLLIMVACIPGSFFVVLLGAYGIIKLLTYQSTETKIENHAKDLLNKYEAEKILQKQKVNKNKDIEQIRDLYAVGVNASEISRITGVPRSTVRRVLGLLK
jgi:hypothetical protein